MKEGIDISHWLRSVGFPMPFIKAEAWKWYNHACQVAEDYDISIEEAKKLPLSPSYKPLSEEEKEEIRKRDDWNNPEDWIEVEDPNRVAIHLSLSCDVSEGERLFHQTYDIDSWTDSFFGKRSSHGCWQGDQLIWDICITWDTLEKMISAKTGGFEFL